MSGDRVVVEAEAFAGILRLLAGEGYTLIGPAVRDGAIVYEPLAGADQLPQGWTDSQNAGAYRLSRTGGAAWFGFTVGPQAWKRQLHSPDVRLWEARREGREAVLGAPPETAPPRYAFIGVRGCDLRAIAIQDAVLAGTRDASPATARVADPHYAARRRDLFILAAHCTRAGGTCFCASMGSGPRAAAGYDLAVTELVGKGRHEFVVDVGTAAGAEIVRGVVHQPCDGGRAREADEAVARAAREMGRRMDPTGVRDLLVRNLDHPRWDAVAERCLGCGNCTQVCPTCFCTRVEDVTDLAGGTAARRRVWDSCFEVAFAHLHGGSVRSSVRSRYRQWLTHKLAFWVDQFGVSGCVGCGRCIAWCPVGIDLTEEVRAIRESENGAVAVGGAAPAAARGG